MIRASVTDVKNRLSHYLRLVKRGETVEILERSSPIARLQAADAAATNEDEYLAGLEREGLILAPQAAADRSFGRKHPPVACKGDALQALRWARSPRSERNEL